jgi:hypothetical protein
VEREHRHLDGERHREREEQEALGLRREGAEQRLVEIEAPRAVRLVGDDQDRDQHEQRAGHGEDEELHRGVDPALSAPDADQEIHRDQHRLPEHVEQEEIERREGAEHAGLEQAHRDHELADAGLDRCP